MESGRHFAQHEEPASTGPELLPVAAPTRPEPKRLAPPRSLLTRGFEAPAALAVVLLVAVLVPLVLISRFNHSYADDWHYGVWAHLALQETGNPLAALAAAFEQVPKAWFEWQGTYTAIFLMAIQPGVFGEGVYAIAAIIIMVTLVAGTLFFWRVALVEQLGAGRDAWLCVSCVTLALQLLLQPSAVEGIFWYNSAIYYTFFHALSLVLFALLMRAIRPREEHGNVGAVIWSAVVAVLLAGGNFVTVLVSVELVVVIFVVLLVQRRQEATLLLPALFFLVLGAAISMAAPGNSVRQATQFPDAGAGVLGTIGLSSVAGFRFLAEWSNGLVVLGMLALAPVAVAVVRSRAARGITWRLPGLVSAGSVALFATSFTPTFFSMGNDGPGRVQNARFDLFIVLLVVNLVWWCGWICARRRAMAVAAREAGEGSGLVRPVLADGTLALFSLGALLVLSLCVCAQGFDAETRQSLSSASAAESLITGQAEAYDQQVQERLEYLETSLGTNVRVAFYHDVPRVLLMGDIRDNMDNYINYRLAQWYGKYSIVGYWPEEDTAQAS